MKIREIDGNTIISGTDISLDDTFGCGQCFRWSKKDGNWTGVAGSRVVTVNQQGDTLTFFDTPENEVRDFWVSYLDLGHDYSTIAEPFASDEYLTRAARYGRGIHILRQDPVETVISFIISSNNNISRISGIVDRFCALYGSSVIYRGSEYHAFPTLQQLSLVTLDGLQPIRAGFRDKYILDAATKLSDGMTDIASLAAMDTADARKELMKIKGIGNKVADCVLLFGFARYEVFPKDVWIKRTMAQLYGDDFDEHRFGSNAGIIQQYFFHYARNSGKE